MSQLTEALQRISTWIEKHQIQKDGKIISILAPGLTHEQIESKVRDLPFRLSLELYELYQWHNGADYKASRYYEKVDLRSIFSDIKFHASFYIFLSLEQALEISEEIGAKQGKYRLPIFALENGSNCALVDQERREISPVVDDCGSSNHHLFSSVTEMMVKCARDMETGWLWFR